jgi:hypothetical protein
MLLSSEDVGGMVYQADESHAYTDTVTLALDV